MLKPYNMKPLDLSKKFSTDLESGLNANQAKSRIKEFGLNKLAEKKEESEIIFFLKQFKNPLIFLLIFAIIINIFLGNIINASLITIIILINSIVGLIQEKRTRNILNSLKSFIKAECVVIRERNHIIIPDEQLVPGDIIVLQEGFKVPADARITDSSELIVDESMLTGESLGIHKISQELDQENLQVFDQKNMLFKGTNILSGSGLALVVATGQNTEIGKLNKIISEIEVELPLKKQLNILSKNILNGSIIIAIFLFLFGLFWGKNLIEMFLSLTALLVAIVPEGLPMVLTFVLIYGTYKMAQKNCLFKHLQAVDSLAYIDILVVDKTGTLTKNEMAVVKVFTDNNVYEISGNGYHAHGDIFLANKKVTINQNESLYFMAIAGSLLNRAELKFEDKKFHIKGDPTEAAIYVFSKKIGLKKENLEKEFEKIVHFSFNPQTRYHLGFYKKENKIYSFIMGSPEHILSHCENIDKNILDQLDKLLEVGFRVVAVAYKIFDVSEQDKIKNNNFDFLKNLIKNFKFIGFYSIQDAIRKEIKPLIEKIRNSGIKIIMSTGDHKKTALYVAKEVGIFKDGDDIINGSDFNLISGEDFHKKIENTTVFSRVTPENKLLIINTLRDLRYLVAMTGDGVNDVPALLAADVGIAMGITGTEVTKEASDVILLDDSFSSIALGIEWGRHIFLTIRKIVFYLLSTNLAELLLISFSFILNMPTPLTIIQILWINLVTDGFFDLALIFEPKEKNLINKKITGKLSLLDFKLYLRLIILALIMAISSLILFHYYLKNFGLIKAQTITMLTLSMFQWFNAYNSRSEDKSIFTLGIFSNKSIILATVLVSSLTFLILYVPILREYFNFSKLNLIDIFIATSISSLVLIVDEIRKLFFYKQD